MNATDVPISITPEANDLLDEWGLRPVLDKMLSFVRESVPDLESVRVRRIDQSGEPDYPKILVVARRSVPWYLEDPTQHAWVGWMARECDGEVCTRFTFQVAYPDADGW